MSPIIKMKCFRTLLVLFMLVGAAELISGEVDLNLLNPIVVQKITSESLEQEKIVFEKFAESYCDVGIEQSILQKMVNDAFSNEQRAYAQSDSNVLFFHALHEDQVVGYISCDLLPNFQVLIRQLVVDPLMFDTALVKELLFAIFATAPKTKYVTVYCPVACSDLAILFEELGFVRSEEVGQATGLCRMYELKIHPKCKICDVLYADIWENEDDEDSDWSDSVGSLDDEFGRN